MKKLLLYYRTFFYNICIKLSTITKFLFIINSYLTVIINNALASLKIINSFFGTLSIFSNNSKAKTKYRFSNKSTVLDSVLQKISHQNLLLFNIYKSLLVAEAKINKMIVKIKYITKVSLTDGRLFKKVQLQISKIIFQIKALGELYIGILKRIKIINTLFSLKIKSIVRLIITTNQYSINNFYIRILSWLHAHPAIYNPALQKMKLNIANISNLSLRIWEYPIYDSTTDTLTITQVFSGEQNMENLMLQ